MTTATALSTSADSEAINRPSERCCARHEALWLCLVLMVGILLRLVLLWRFDAVGLEVWDEGDYDKLAVNMVQHGEYSFVPGQPVSLRPPLYPALVAAVYSVAGIHNYQAVRFVQAVLSLVTTAVIYVLGRRLYGPTAGLIAAAMVCFYPSLLGANNLLLTETLFTLLVCVLVLFMQQYLSSSKQTWLVAAGVTLGLAALTRSVLWLFPPLACVFLLVYGRERTWVGRLGSAALLGGCFCITLAPWTVRNTLLQQTFTTVDVMGGRNVMMGNYEFTLEDRPWATIAVEGDKAWHSVLARKYGELSGKTQGQIDKLAMRYAMDYVLVHPLQTAGRSFAKVFHFWQLERELVAGAQQGIWGRFDKSVILALAAVILGFYIVTIVAGVFGAWIRPPEWRMHLFLLLLLTFVTGLHAVAFGHSRYHLPLMPLVILYAASALSNWRMIFSQWKNWRFVCAVAMAFILMLSWGLELKNESRRFQSKMPTSSQTHNHLLNT